MTIRHLKIFIAVYREMSITKAAEKLHMAQPGVSFAIKELEDTYHVRLFDRINRRLFVTDAGRLFFDYASHIVNSFDQMESAMMSPQGAGSIHLGSSITVGNFLIPDAVCRFHEQYPDCRVSVSVDNSHRIIRKVLRNELDFGVVEDRGTYEQLMEVPFMEDRLYFVCRAEHPLAEKEAVTLEELCRYPFFMREPGSAAREITDSLMKSCQQKYEILVESVSNQALIQAVQKYPGITVLSARLIERELKEGKVKLLPLYPESFRRQFLIVYHRQKYISRLMRELIGMIQSCGSLA